MREERTLLEEDADMLEGDAREVKEKEVDEVMEKLANLPEQQELDDLENEHNDALDKIEAMATGSKWNPGQGIIGRGVNAVKTAILRQGKEHRQVLKELSVDLVTKFIEREGRKVSSG